MNGDADGHDLVTIATFLHAHEAHLLRMRLAAEDIEAFVLDQHSHGSHWGGFAVQTRLQVRARDAERAAEVLARDDQDPHTVAAEGTAALVEELDEPAIADEDVLRCPSCQGSLVHRRPTPLWLWILIFLFVGVPLLGMRRKWECEICKHRWTEG